MASEKLFRPFPALTTARLVLRQVNRADIDDLFAIFSQPEVTRYYDLDTFSNRAQADKLLTDLGARYENRQAIRWGITRKPADQIIGTCGLVFQPNGHGGLGYELSRPYWRQGIMSEAVWAVVEFAFERTTFNRLEAFVMPGNTASELLLEKLGFLREGVLRELMYFKGAYQDLTCFSLLRRDYEAGAI